MAEWKTQSARRQDLEVLEVNPPEGYIGHRLYPAEPVHQKSGIIYYQPVGATFSAQTGRNQRTGTLTRNFFGSADKSYAVTSVEVRASITKDEVEQFGGVATADKYGAMAAKRAVQNALEAAAATQATSGTATQIPAGGFFRAVRAAEASIKLYGGKLALACSVTAYNRIMELTEVVARLSFSGATPMDNDVLRSLKPEVLQQMLQQYVGVREILVGDDTYWPAGKIVVCKLPDTAPLSYKLQPELGRRIAYSTDNKEVCEIESAPNTDQLCNDYTATSYSAIVEFNAGARAVLALPAEDADDAGDSGDSGDSGSGSGSGEE